jgi:hypothetical protein
LSCYFFEGGGKSIPVVEAAEGGEPVNVEMVCLFLGDQLQAKGDALVIEVFVEILSCYIVDK